jgi:hypothetical protein
MQTNIVLSAIHFILVFFLAALGVFLVGAALSDPLRYSMMDILQYQPKLVLSLGLGLLGITLFLLVGFSVSYRHKVLRFRMNSHSAVVQDAIILGTIEKYWKTQFPAFSVQTQIAFHHGKKLEILLAVAPIEEAKKKEFLKKVEKDLSKLLYDVFDYDKDFLLTISPL